MQFLFPILYTICTYEFYEYVQCYKKCIKNKRKEYHNILHF